MEAAQPSLLALCNAQCLIQSVPAGLIAAEGHQDVNEKMAPLEGYQVSSAPFSWGWAILESIRCYPIQNSLADAGNEALCLWARLGDQICCRCFRFDLPSELVFQRRAVLG